MHGFSDWLINSKQRQVDERCERREEVTKRGRRLIPRQKAWVRLRGATANFGEGGYEEGGRELQTTCFLNGFICCESRMGTKESCTTKRYKFRPKIDNINIFGMEEDGPIEMDDINLVEMEESFTSEMDV